MKTWLEPEPVDIPDDLAQAVGGSPLVSQILYRRGFSTVDSALAFLDPNRYTPASADELPGMALAVDRLLLAIERGETICVWGDFDVDGQTSTSLLVEMLRTVGGKVVYYIPVRARESHGVHRNTLSKIINRTQSYGFGWQAEYAPVSLLLTCDTGVSAHDALQFARQQGVDVIVTDHHELPEQLPEAVAIINPRLLPADHPLSALPGVGVAYKLVQALLNRLGGNDSAKSMLDLVALGIVADVASQQRDTRWLLQLGLAKLRQGLRPGILAILELAGIDATQLNEEHIAFEIAPRLNALGRLGNANLAVELLTTLEQGKAHLLAAQLETMNNQRKLETSQVFQGALAQLERQAELLEQPVIVLANPTWPGGIIGIVASRLVERFQKPAALIANPPGEPARGSIRSIPGLHITEALRAASAHLLNFGGHAMAAGFALDPLQIDAFRRSLGKTILQSGPLPEPVITIDGVIELADMTLEFVHELDGLSPFGAGNPAVVLVCRNLRLSKVTPVGKNAEHLALTVMDEQERSQKVIWWQGAGWPLPEGKFDLACTLRSTTFRGESEVQVEWVDYRTAPVDLSTESSAYRPKILDFRMASQPFAVLNQIIGEQTVQIWAEGEATSRLAARNISSASRSNLISGAPLVVWSSPPDVQVFSQIIRQTKPTTLYLFAIPTGSETPERFVNRLAGLVKHALAANGGQARLVDLAAAMGQNEPTTLKGLALLQTKGWISVQIGTDGTLILSRGGAPSISEEQKCFGELTELLDEARAFRAYYRRANLDDLDQLARVSE